MNAIVSLTTKFLVVLFAITLCLASCDSATSKYDKYNLYPVHEIEIFKASIKDDSSKALIDLKEYIPSLVLDIRYATDNNFVGRTFYNSAKAYARTPVARALSNIQRELQEVNLGLKIYDAYRPYSITVEFYEAYEDTNYVASPYQGSRHNRGAAVDLTLIDLSTGKELDMGTAYDDFTELAHPNSTNHSELVLGNRETLIKLMAKYGFSVYPTEWWHFDFDGWENYEILDLSFEQLDR